MLIYTYKKPIKNFQMSFLQSKKKKRLKRKTGKKKRSLKVKKLTIKKIRKIRKNE